MWDLADACKLVGVYLLWRLRHQLNLHDVAGDTVTMGKKVKKKSPKDVEKILENFLKPMA